MAHCSLKIIHRLLYDCPVDTLWSEENGTIIEIYIHREKTCICIRQWNDYMQKMIYNTFFTCIFSLLPPLLEYRRLTKTVEGILSNFEWVSHSSKLFRIRKSLLCLLNHFCKIQRVKSSIPLKVKTFLHILLRWKWSSEFLNHF